MHRFRTLKTKDFWRVISSLIGLRNVTTFIKQNISTLATFSPHAPQDCFPAFCKYKPEQTMLG